MLLATLAFTAISLFVIGWLLLLIDFVSGCRVINRIPEPVIAVAGLIHNCAWIGIIVVGVSSVIWEAATA